MKIVFTDITGKKPEVVKAQCYKGTGNINLTKDIDVIYPINAVLAEKLKKDDEVKVVLLKTKFEDKTKQQWIDRNLEIYKEELNACNTAGAKISYVVIETEFNENQAMLEKRYKAMAEQLEEDCEIYADITFGIRTLPIVLIGVLNFAEKFFNADIKSIVYGKVEFVADENGGDQKITSPEIFDVTGIYYLNHLTSTMEAPNSKAALDALNAIFGN